MNCVVCGQFLHNNTHIANIRDSLHNDIRRVIYENIATYPTGIRLNDTLIYICSIKCSIIYRHNYDHNDKNTESKKIRLI
jgi:hypothetical protein